MRNPVFVPQPAVLLYLPVGDHYTTLTDYLSGKGIRLIVVAQNQGGETLSSLLGLEPHKPSMPMPLPSEPVMVFFGIGRKDSDQLLAFLRAHRPIALKAMATPVNLKWTFARLAEELAKEHQQLN